PGSVSLTERVVRTNKRAPIASSRAAMARVTAGGLICSWRADAAKLPVSATFTKIRMACQRSTPVSRILMCRLYYGHRHARDGTPAGSESKMDGFGRRIRWLGRHGAADQHLALGHGGGGFADVGHLSLEQPGAAGAAGAGAAT